MVLSSPPAVIIIARHGARLDAADPNWHTSSNAPYDTPLTYGGWTQTRALGARIASLLHARDAANIPSDDSKPRRRFSDAGSEPAPPPSPSPRPGPAKKHRVVIHSSPFLRCIQSSIAISAGMAHYHGNLARISIAQAVPHDVSDLQSPSRLFGGPSRSLTLDSKAIEERLTRNHSSESLKRMRSREEHLPEFQRPKLRIDAFLGEWLSPEYFELSVAPPTSDMMVAGAKAELIKAAEPIRGAKIVERDGSVTVFPGADLAQKQRDRSISFSMEELAQNLPGHRAAAKSLDDGHPPPPEVDTKKKKNTGYIPPTPTYALLPSGSIPAGYVTHARDRCTDVDLQWDSMRDPQQWGDGGTYGEEWSSMHRRFRTGIASMVEWYKTKAVDSDPQEEQEEQDDARGPDDNTDVVLVIVTHGAGCNAIIGALTNQPVLMDIGMGSLTMAVRRPVHSSAPLERPRSNPGAYRRRRSSSIDLGLNQEYEMKLIASTEHLRAGVDPLTIPQLAAGNHPSPGMPSIPEAVRSNPGSGSATPKERTGSFSKNSALGSMRRTSIKSKSSRAYSPSPVVTSPTSSGLWGGSGSTADFEAPPLSASAFDTAPDSAVDSSSEPPHQSDQSDVQSTDGSTVPSHRQGLWGVSPSSQPGSRRSTLSSRR